MTKNSNVELRSWADTATVCNAVHNEDQPFVIKLIRRADGGKGKPEVRFDHATLAEHACNFNEWQKNRWEAFMMLGITDGNGYSSQNIEKVWAVALDLDGGTDIEAWNRSAFRPSLAIRTSTDRYHLVWIFDRWLEPKDAYQLQTALATRFNADRTFANLTQAVRLPGFVNGKHGTEVALLDWSDGSRLYDFELLRSAFDVDLTIRHLQYCQPRFTKSLEIQRPDTTKDELIADLRSALEFIPSDDYEVWYRLGMALQSLDLDGYQLWFDWSKQSSSFNAGEMPSKWKALACVKSINLASIFAIAAQHGWRNPGFRREAHDEKCDLLSERMLGRMLADEMSEHYAAVPNDGRSRQAHLLLNWDGEKYVVLSDIQRRKSIESYVSKVRLANLDNKEFVRFLNLKSANNRMLDDLGEHLCEYLVESSAGRAASGYPYFATQNGVLNLLSGLLVPPAFRALSLVSSGVVFDPNAKAPLFMKTLDEIFEGDQEMIRAVIRLLGYIMQGNPKEHVLIVFYGPAGRNGKTLIVQAAREVFGDYAHALPSSVILAKSHNNEGPTPALAKLYQKRLAVISEPSPKHPLDAGFIKLMTGGEHITARPLHGQLIEFEPEFTPLIVTNKIPAAPDDDHALWRRMKIVKFTRTFSEEEIDADLKKKLAKEKSGILNLLLAGIQDYLANGLNLPEKIKSAGLEQRKEFDPFEAWHEECVIDAEKATETALQALASSYEAWSQTNRQFRRLSKKELSNKLSEHGYEKVDRRRYIHFCGLTLRETAES